MKTTLNSVLLLVLLCSGFGAHAYECGENTIEGEPGDDEQASCVLSAMRRSASSFTSAAQRQEKGEYEAMCDMLSWSFYELLPYKGTDWSEYENIGDRPDKMRAMVWDTLKKNKCPQVISRFKQSAEAGDTWGQYNLAEAYATGNGVPRNPALAVEWHQKAIAQGDTDSMKMLAKRYAEGDGVPLDQVKAFELWLMAAKSGPGADGEEERGAQQEVAVRYHKGIGVEQNFEQAAYWYKASRDNGNEWAGEQLDEMYKSGQVKKPLFSW